MASIEASSSSPRLVGPEKKAHTSRAAVAVADALSATPRASMASESSPVAIIKRVFTTLPEDLSEKLDSPSVNLSKDDFMTLAQRLDEMAKDIQPKNLDDFQDVTLALRVLAQNHKGTIQSEFKISAIDVDRNGNVDRYDSADKKVTSNAMALYFDKMILYSQQKIRENEEPGENKPINLSLIKDIVSQKQGVVPGLVACFDTVHFNETYPSDNLNNEFIESSFLKISNNTVRSAPHLKLERPKRIVPENPFSPASPTSSAPTSSGPTAKPAAPAPAASVAIPTASASATAAPSASPAASPTAKPEAPATAAKPAALAPAAAAAAPPASPAAAAPSPASPAAEAPSPALPAAKPTASAPAASVAPAPAAMPAASAPAASAPAVATAAKLTAPAAEPEESRVRKDLKVLANVFAFDKSINKLPGKDDPEWIMEGISRRDLDVTYNLDGIKWHGFDWENICNTKVEFPSSRAQAQGVTSILNLNNICRLRLGSEGHYFEAVIYKDPADDQNTYITFLDRGAPFWKRGVFHKTYQVDMNQLGRLLEEIFYWNILPGKLEDDPSVSQPETVANKINEIIGEGQPLSELMSKEEPVFLGFTDEIKPMKTGKCVHANQALGIRAVMHYLDYRGRRATNRSALKTESDEVKKLYKAMTLADRFSHIASVLDHAATVPQGEETVSEQLNKCETDQEKIDFLKRYKETFVEYMLKANCHEITGYRVMDEDFFKDMYDLEIIGKLKKRLELTPKDKVLYEINHLMKDGDLENFEYKSNLRDSIFRIPEQERVEVIAALKAKGFPVRKTLDL